MRTLPTRGRRKYHTRMITTEENIIRKTMTRATTISRTTMNRGRPNKIVGTRAVYYCLAVHLKPHKPPHQPQPPRHHCYNQPQFHHAPLAPQPASHLSNHPTLRLFPPHPLPHHLDVHPKALPQSPFHHYPQPHLA